MGEAFAHKALPWGFCIMADPTVGHLQLPKEKMKNAQQMSEGGGGGGGGEGMLRLGIN